MRSKIGVGMAIAMVGSVASGCASSVSGATEAKANTGATVAAVMTASAAAPAPAAVKATAGATGVRVSSTASFPIPTGYDADRDATADIQAALGVAKAEHKEVLLDFGADWCPDCVALDTLFHSAQVEPLLKSGYVVVPIDVGDWNLNISTASRYVDLSTSGIPALVVISAGGQVREATDDGSFSDARTMDAGQVATFLTDWAAGTGQ